MSAGEPPDTPAQKHQFNMESEQAAANAGDSFGQGSARPTPPAVSADAQDWPEHLAVAGWLELTGPRWNLMRSPPPSRASSWRNSK